MSATINITLANLYAVVGQFLQLVVGVDPATSQTVTVTRGNINRASMPSSAFINMLAEVSGRLRTNVHTWNSTTQTQTAEQGTKVKVSLEAFGPLSHDWIKMVEVLWRDVYGVDNFKAILATVAPGATGAPLYSDEPYQSVLVNGEEQYEDCWAMDLYLQCNFQVTVGQQSATSLSVVPINVNAQPIT